LDKQVQASLQGEGKIVFIAGDAGRGKTALMTEFVSRAIHANPDIIVCSGICSAYAGIGDPYLPFREVLSFLTGEIEVNRAPSAQYPENIRRVWQALPLILQTLVEHAPNLIEVLVPEKALLSRARRIRTWWGTLASTAPGGSFPTAETLSGPEQNTIFGQFSNFLLHLASHQPILITLDDLHWADDASLGLLFHLARRLSGSRILILATYRP
jgi:predicted ATPase